MHGVAQQAPTKPEALPFLVDGQPGEEIAGHRIWRLLGDRLWGCAACIAGDGDGVVADHETLVCADVGRGITGPLVLPAVLLEPHVELGYTRFEAGAVVRLGQAAAAALAVAVWSRAQSGPRR